MSGCNLQVVDQVEALFIGDPAKGIVGVHPPPYGQIRAQRREIMAGTKQRHRLLHALAALCCIELQDGLPIQTPQDATLKVDRPAW